MSTIMKYPAIFSIIKTRSQNNISLYLHEQVQPSFDSCQCTGIAIVFGQHFRLSLKRAMKEGSSILCFQHTLIMPFSERDTSSLLQPTTASHLCILMSINYTLNETIKNCRAIDVCVPSLEE